MSKAVIVGAGGHAQMMWAVCQITPSPSHEVVGWLETATYAGPPTILDLPVYRQTEEDLASLLEQDVNAFYFGIGKVTASSTRWQVYEQLNAIGLAPLTLIHPMAVISPYANISPGCYIGAGAIVQPFANVGPACILNTGCVVEHHCVLGQDVHVGPNATLCGATRVGNHSLIGAGAVVIQEICIGQGVIVGAGSTVIRTIPDQITVVGNPAREMIVQSN